MKISNACRKKAQLRSKFVKNNIVKFNTNHTAEQFGHATSTPFGLPGFSTS